MSRTRRLAVWLLQLVLGAVVLFFAARGLSQHWSELQALRFDIDARPGWLAAALAIVLLTYGLLVEAWRRVLAGWGQRLPYGQAMRIWVLANMGRYVPGKVWTVAGLAVLAQRAGVAGWAATGAAVVMQALAVGTGVSVVAAVVPGVVSPVWLAVAASAALGTVAVLAWPKSVRLLAKVVRDAEFRPLAPRVLALGAIVTIASWVAYGMAFWCLARGTLGEGALGLSVADAIGVFTAGYIVGLMFILVPAGIGVREAVFIPLLAPTLGGAGAVALTVASRLLLTITEIGAALAGLFIRRRTEEHRRD